MTFEQVINARYSARSFKDVAVENEKIDNIINLTMTAPTAKNMQPVKTYVITDSEMLKKLDDGVTICRFGATAVFAVCYDKTMAWTNSNGESRGEMDASIAATHIMLSATNEGLGSCWVCLFDKDKLKELLKLDDNIVPCCLIMTGYKADDCEPSVRHTQRKPVDEAFIKI